MIRHFMEWYMSKADPRFKAYREARLIYEAYILENRIQIHQLTPAHSKEALEDGSLKHAEQLYRQAIELSKEAGAQGDAATGFYQLGMLLHLQGRTDEAVQPLGESIRILEELPQTDQSMQATLSGNYYHLGIIACRKAKFNKGRRYLEKSLEIDEANNDTRGKLLTKTALEAYEGMAESDIDKSIDVNYNKNAPDIDSPSTEESLVSPTEKHIPYDTPPMQPDLRTSSSRHHKKDTDHNQFAERKAKASYQQGVVWLLSHSSIANDSFMELLDKLADNLHGQIVVSRAAFGSPVKEQSVLPPLEYNEQLCAVVMVIEKDGLQNKDFRYWVKWCIEKVAARDDFRMFVYLHDITIEEIERLARDDELIATLIDTIQLSIIQSPDNLYSNLKTYCENLNDIRREARWRSIKVGFAVVLAWIATKIQLICGGMLVIATIGALILKEDIIVTRLFGVNVLMISIISGIVFFPLITTPMFLLLKGPAIARSMREVPRTRIWLILCFLLGPAIIGLSQRVGANFSYIVMGIFIGVLLDITRRKGIQAKRESLSLESALTVSKMPSLPAEIAAAVRQTTIDPIRCPLFPAIAPKVFISYTRSSEWSRSNASELHEKLLNIGVKSFLDRENIGEGSHWRNKLNRSIANANVFIAVIDRHSISREWVAAEMITAIRGKHFSSLPEIIVLIAPELSGLIDSSMLPIFRAVLQEYNTPAKEVKPRIISVKASTIGTIVSGLNPNRFRTLSVFPPQLSALLSILTIPLVSIGPFGAILGIPAALFAFLQYGGKVDSGAILLSWGLLSTAYVLCAYWLGFVGRLIMTACFEIRHDNLGSLTKIHAFSCLGLAGILVAWSPYVTGPMVGWSLALCYTGWLMADLFTARTVTEHPKFRMNIN